VPLLKLRIGESCSELLRQPLQVIDGRGDVVLGGCSQVFVIGFGNHVWIPW
jgi:hypothetical protein